MSDKPHTRIIVGATLLALAVEGWQGTIGETVAHSMGIGKSLIGLVAAVVLGVIYSYVYEAPEPPHKKPAAKPRRPPKSH